MTVTMCLGWAASSRLQSESCV